MAQKYPRIDGIKDLRVSMVQFSAFLIQSIIPLRAGYVKGGLDPKKTEIYTENIFSKKGYNIVNGI